MLSAAPQARAILWAHWRGLLNHYTRSSRAGLVLAVGLVSLWYGAWLAFAIFLAFTFSSVSAPWTALPAGLLFVCLYWQTVPVLLATSGISLSVRRLLVYPVPPSQLFLIELMLRAATSFEMVLVLAGLSAGLVVNPQRPWWAPLGLVLFGLFNLCLAAGLRELMVRLFERRRVREIAVLVLAMTGAVPQLIFALGYEHKVASLFRGPGLAIWPWAGAAAIAVGNVTFAAVLTLGMWTAAAALFGRWQFARTLRFDASERNATVGTPARGAGLFEGFLRWPSLVFPDPLAVLVEKEIRFLLRAPRFRLLFLMGCTVGLVIWLPLAAGREHLPAFESNYLTFACLYALLMMADVCVWNAFGFDRAAAQAYWALPAPFATVLAAKNISVAFFVLAETTIITLACSLLRMPLSATAAAEAYAVTLVAALYCIAMGNLTSTSNARPIDAAKAMRSGTPGRYQALLFLLYPLASGPVLLAYGARYAFSSEAAFFAVLLLAALTGAAVYRVSLDSAVAAAERNKERLLAALARTEGLIDA